MDKYYKEYGIREYLLDLIDLGYTSNEILDIIKVGDQGMLGKILEQKLYLMWRDN